MLQFQFVPRHPVQHVGFTACGCKIVTVQPFVGVVVRDRFSGEPLHTLNLNRMPSITSFSISLITDWGRVQETFFTWEDGDPVIQTISMHGTIGEHYRDNYIRFILRSNEAVQLYFIAQYSEEMPDELMPPTNIRVETSASIEALTSDLLFGIGIRSRNRPVVVNMTNGEVVATLNTSVTRLAITEQRARIVSSPRGDRIAVCNGSQIAIFDLSELQENQLADSLKKSTQTLDPICTIERPDPELGGTVADRAAERWVPPIVFAPDSSTFLTLGLRNRVQQYEASSGGLVHEWGWRLEQILSLAVAPDGTMAMAGAKLGKVVLWDLE